MKLRKFQNNYVISRIKSHYNFIKYVYSWFCNFCLDEKVLRSYIYFIYVNYSWSNGWTKFAGFFGGEPIGTLKRLKKIKFCFFKIQFS